MPAVVEALGILLVVAGLAGAVVAAALVSLAAAVAVGSLLAIVLGLGLTWMANLRADSEPDQ